MDERMELDIEHYKKRCAKIEELAHIWERCAKDFADIAEERRKLLGEMKVMLCMWISLSVLESVLLIILATAR